jgi:SecD/SecF fusion protein
MKNKHLLKMGGIILTALILGFVNLPAEQQKAILPATPQPLLDTKYALGLDLQGGSQLDYKIDLQKVPAADQQSIVDGVMNVINNRVNGLGVAEPNIYLSTEGDEQHLIVELPGVKDLEQAKSVVGKTIQLEFKEARTTPDTTAADEMKTEAQSFIASVQKGEDLAVAGKEEQLSNPGKVTFDDVDYQFKSDVSSSLQDVLFNKLAVGQVSPDLIPAQGEYSVDQSGNLAASNGYYVVKLVDKRDQQKTTTVPKTVKVSHILISYQGATRADASVTRTKDQAQALANDVLKQLQGGAKFADLAKQYSDDASNKNTGGTLDQPVTGDGKYAKEFEAAALALQKTGDLSPVTETEFGFHIITADSVTAASTTTGMEPQVKYQKVFFNTAADPWQATGLTGEQFVHADVEFDQLYQPYVSIQFNDQGAKLFEDITGRNVGKQVAIFVGGELISAPVVNEKISGGKAQISGHFTVDQATSLARDLNTGAIPAPIILSGQETIGATLGQDALTRSLWAGLIGFILVALFMIGYYRLPGLLATLALIVYSMIMLFLIKFALPLWISIILALVIFVVIVMKIINSRDSGPEKTIGLLLSCFILFFITFVLSTQIVMTLAGIAGVIIAIGMAVDANILIFERVKEELRDGRTLSSAIEIGFDRAWNSIRDSNFSSLITCGILFYFGSSIIQGFAFNLAAGILVSMFTAITITKTFLNALVNTKLADKLWLFGTPKNKGKKLVPIIPYRKITYYISGTLLVLAVIGIPVFGLKLGLDFTGGTEMQFKFTNSNVTPQQISQALQTAADNVNKSGALTAAAATTTTTAVTQQSGTQAVPAGTPTLSAATPSPDEETTIDIGTPEIVTSSEGFMIKTRHISAAAHDLMIPELKKTLGNFDEISFTTVGPTVGESLRYRAIFAVIFASVMIILYIAFAFRKVPRHIGQWRFGVSAIIALLHDLGIMLGIYVYFGVFFGVQIDALFITAMLTVMGFSVHDTIVVFDRIREKLKYQKRDETFAEVANQAVNETIARSINTSFSVFLTLLALAVFGADSIRFFVLALMVGIVAGTYSSIFVASPILVDWQEYIQKKNGRK